MEPIRTEKKITIQTLNRLSYYLSCLRQKQQCGLESATAAAIAEELGITEVVVRKDLSAIREGKGKPNTGFSIPEMVSRIEDFLGYNNTTDAVVAGTGSFWKLLLSGTGSESFGMHILAGFDPDLSSPCVTAVGVDIFPMGKLEDLCRRMHVRVGILAVPAEQAQSVCDRMVAGGIRYILNYAQVFLSAPEGVYIQNENPAASLAAFLSHIRSSQQVST